MRDGMLVGAVCTACMRRLYVPMAIVLPQGTLLAPQRLFLDMLRPTLPAETYRIHSCGAQRRGLCHVIPVTHRRPLSLACSLHSSLPCSPVPHSHPSPRPSASP